MKKMKAQKNRFTKAFAGIMGGLMIAFAVSAPAGAAQVCLNNGSSSTPSSIYTFDSVCKTNGTCQTSACKTANCNTANSNCGATAGCQTAVCNITNKTNCNKNLSAILSSLTGRDVSQIQQMLKSGKIDLNMIQNLCPKKSKTVTSKSTPAKQATKTTKNTTTSKSNTAENGDYFKWRHSSNGNNPDRRYGRWNSRW